MRRETVACAGYRAYAPNKRAPQADKLGRMDVYPGFVLDKRLPRLLVTRQLLSDLEVQCIATAKDFTRSTAPQASNIKISIEDAYGTETFASAQASPRRDFPRLRAR